MLSMLGFLTVLTFVVLIMTKRLSALVALITIPVIFGLIGGFGVKLAPMIATGLKGVAPIAIMLMFAILYFSIMIDTGLFDSMAKTAIRLAKGNPVNVIVGTAIMSSVISLSGDGTTTLMVIVTAMLPIYKKLDIKRVYLAIFIGIPNIVLNCVPWGGPMPRIMSVLKVDSPELFNPIIPAMCLTLLFIIVLAFIVGQRERSRLGITVIDEKSIQEMAASLDADDNNIKRPKRIWINLVLTALLIGIIISNLLPLIIVFAIGSALALLINYPDIKMQRKRIAENAGNIIEVLSLVAAAGVFMGILTGTKMADAMAQTLVGIIPPVLGPHMAIITALISGPGTFFLSNDAFYFGILPALTQTAANYGITAAEMGRAGLLGQPLHGLSPLLPALYVSSGLIGIEVSELMRASLPLSTLVFVAFIIFAVLTGAIPL